MKKGHTLLIKLFVALIVAFSSSCNAKNMGKENNIQTVKMVDIKRYMGVWYEIARFDHSFERNLVGVTATYSLRDDGKVDVLNQGFKNSLTGKHRSTKGWAKIPDPNFPGELKVYFFLWFGAPYNILELDENYQYALVGSSSSKYLWILSRTPQMEESTYRMLLEKASNRGYDISKLIQVVQPQNK